jgi:hypothetical protein
MLAVLGQVFTGARRFSKCDVDPQHHRGDSLIAGVFAARSASSPGASKPQVPMRPSAPTSSVN